MIGIGETQLGETTKGEKNIINNGKKGKREEIDIAGVCHVSLIDFRGRENQDRMKNLVYVHISHYMYINIFIDMIIV